MACLVDASIACAGQSDQVLHGVLLEVQALAPSPGLTHGPSRPAGRSQLGRVHGLNGSLHVVKLINLTTCVHPRQIMAIHFALTGTLLDLVKRDHWTFEIFRF
jgi:hypothetical protein